MPGALAAFSLGALARLNRLCTVAASTRAVRLLSEISSAYATPGRSLPECRQRPLRWGCRRDGWSPMHWKHGFGPR